MPEPGANPEVTAYIDAASPAARPLLNQLRELVREVAPEADERISYGMPSYHLGGRIVYFAAQQQHLGVYGLVGTLDAAPELKQHQVERGTLRFPLDAPLPVAPLRSALEARVKQNREAGDQGGERPPSDT